MELTQNELIGKLEKISGLYKATVAIRTEMDEFVPDDHYKREVIVPAFPGDFQTEEERAVWTDRLDHTGAEAQRLRSRPIGGSMALKNQKNQKSKILKSRKIVNYAISKRSLTVYPSFLRVLLFSFSSAHC